MTVRRDTGNGGKKQGTHSFVDVFSGAIKFLLHPFLEEIDAEL